MLDAERTRLNDDAARTANWKRWGPYLSERQWGTVREDYSATGNCWDALSHDHARSRAYRWGEDGLLGFTDRECRMCVAVALWNGRDPILKERLFGLTGPEGNHGEDVKEVYHYLDATPTASWCSALYKYPLDGYPYAELVEGNRQRGRSDPEFELVDTGAFAASRYVDVRADYAKAGPDDILLTLTLSNRSHMPAEVHALPTVWFRNSWIWGCKHDGCDLKPTLRFAKGGLEADHDTLGRFAVRADVASDGTAPTWIFTENETNTQRLFGVDQYTLFVKDAFHRWLVDGEADAINPKRVGTKAAAHYHLTLPPLGEVVIRLRWRPANVAGEWFGADFARVVAARRAEADAFYAPVLRGSPDECVVARQAYAGLIWSKQFYHYVVADWIDGDADQPRPPAERRDGRNADWRHLFARDVLSMPDAWEYPWFAAWDLAFHAVPFARIDPHFAKHQLLLLTREWYMHPNGQIPAYEFAFGDVNPPVHAWAAWRVYRIGKRAGDQDLDFLARIFHKLLLNFTWWVNRKDVSGRHLFAGGFLGLDNIGPFDRGRPLPGGAQLAQADGTAWMAFYAARMLVIALELARYDPTYEDVASKFFEHFVAIADAMNFFGGNGLWDEEDGFYYDQLAEGGAYRPVRARSMVGLIPLLATVVLRQEHLERFPGFAKRLAWFVANRRDLVGRIAWLEAGGADAGARLLAIVPRERLVRMLRRVLDESEFLSPHGLRSLSQAHRDAPCVLEVGGERFTIGYEPAESGTGLFGGNSNWRGPVWFPLNHLLIEALRIHHEFYGDTLTVELPVGSGHMATLGEVSDELARRLAGLFLPGPDGKRPCHGDDPRYADDPHWRDLLLFHEYFDGNDGRGLGASHQTGWTALAVEYLGGRPG